MSADAMGSPRSRPRARARRPRTYISACARPVIDDELLAEPLRQPLADQAGRDVGHAARRKANNDAHGPRRIGLRPRDPRHRRQRGSARGQMQKFPTVRKFHVSPSGRVIAMRTAEWKQRTSSS